MAKTQNKQGERLEELESHDGKMWRKVSGYIITMLIGAVIVTAVEFLAGCIINLGLGWNVWDYSNIPFNILGQICLPFSLLWILLSAVAIVLDDHLRYWIYGEEKPHYKLT